LENEETTIDRKFNKNKVGKEFLTPREYNVKKNHQIGKISGKKKRSIMM